MYRNNKGRFITKQRHEYLEMRRFKMFCFIVIGGFIFGIIGEYHNSHEMPHVVETAQAVETVVPDWDPCDLHVILCEHERQEAIDNEIKAISDALGREVTEITKQNIAYIYDKANENNLDYKKMNHVIWCESAFFNLQSHLKYTFTDAKRGIYENEQEMSFGIFQLHTPDHKITPEEALTPRTAIDYAVSLIKQSGYKPWHGYDESSDTCRNTREEYWM